MHIEIRSPIEFNFSYSLALSEMSGESCEDISRDRRNLCDGINTTP